MALVKFYSGLSTAFKPETAEVNSLYFLTDTKQLYKGNVLYSDMQGQDALAAKLADIADGAQVNVLESVTVNGSKLAITDKNVTITIEPGTANGTIKVNGTDVAVTGLKSAAFKDATAFDEAGAAKAVQGDTDKTVKDAMDAAKAAQDDVDAVEGDLGNVDSLSTTNKTVVGAINEVLAAVGAGGTAAAITITTDTTTSGALKSYTVKQGETTVGVIDIPKDMVVESGSVVTNPEGQPEGTYIKLVLANVAEPLFINVGTLVDIYVAKANATQIQLAIDSSTREISASVVAGSIGTAELADAAVVTAKIADANVTKAKLSTEVQASLAKADAAAPQTALDAEVKRAGDAEVALDERLKEIESQLGVSEGGDAPEGGTVDERIEAAKQAAIAAAATDAQGKADAAQAAAEATAAADATAKANKAKEDAVAAAATDATTKANTAEANAKAHADSLNTAMNTRMEAVEAAKHTHDNKAVLDGITSAKVSEWDSAVAALTWGTF